MKFDIVEYDALAWAQRPVNETGKLLAKMGFIENKFEKLGKNRFITVGLRSYMGKTAVS